MNIPYKIVLDLQKPMRPITIDIKKGDNRARKLDITVISDGKKLDLDDVRIATIKGVKPDGSVIYADATITDTGITYDISDSFTEVAGKVSLELELWSSTDQMIQSFEFYLMVYNQLFDENDYVSEDDLAGFKSYMTRAQNAAVQTEGKINAFTAANGELSTIKQEYASTLDEYATYYQELKDDVAAGKFNGPRGRAGERGNDAIGLTGEGLLLSFAIDGPDLKVNFYGNERIPMEINEQGELVMLL